MKKALKIIGISFVAVTGILFVLYLVYLRPFMEKMKETAVNQYDKNLTLVMGGGGNSGILVADSLVLVIDTKMNDAAKKFHQMAVDIAGKRPIVVINTHIHSDHTEGNKYFAGNTIIAGGDYKKADWIKANGEVGMPTEWLKGSKVIPMGDDTATVFTFGKNVHTAGDIMVYLHRRKLLFGGDVILNKTAPVLMGEANPNAYLEVFEALPKQYDIQHIVPGHGALGGIEVLSTFQQFMSDMKLAANDESQKAGLLDKYKDWNGVPIVMSPSSTVKAFQKVK